MKKMPKKIEVLGVTPSEISISENYSYHGQITITQRLEESRPPIGKVQLRIPFDGHQYFPRKAFEELKEKLAQRRFRKVAHLTLGHLQFSDYEHSNLDSVINLTRNEGRMPVEIELSTPEITNKQAFEGGDYELRMELDYVPEPLAFPLVSISAAIVDDLSMEDELEMRRLSNFLDAQRSGSEVTLVPNGSGESNNANGEPSRSPDTFEEPLFIDVDLADLALQAELIRKSIMREEDWHKSPLIFRFKISLNLPKRFRNLTSKELPLDLSIILDWPVSQSHEDVSLEQIKEFVADSSSKSPFEPLWHYLDPEKRQIYGVSERPKLKGKWEPSTETMKFSMPEIWLFLHRPSLLYEQRSFLKGNIVVTLDGSLSGLKLVYTPVSGQKNNQNPVDVNITTRIEVDFNLNLPELFDHRLFLCNQSFELGGVVLNEKVIKTVKEILKDQGFENISDKKLAYDTEMPVRNVSWVLTADKGLGIEKLRIWVLLDGRIKPAERVLEARGLSHTTKVEAGDTTIILRGEMRRTGKELSIHLNRFFNRLKELFHHREARY
jgi:hypothetical protein